MINYLALGKLAATFGFGGEMVLQHHLGKKSALKGLQTLFIEKQKDELLPYFIESVRVKSDSELYIKLEGIESKEAARVLVQKQVWLPEDEFKKYAARTTPVSLLGFHVINEGEDIGEILEVIEQPHQLLCRVAFGSSGEALIPVHEDTLDKIDKRAKKVHVHLPDGLLDIYR
jgi:16S rRNA processing protein RimM